MKSFASKAERWFTQKFPTAYYNLIQSPRISFKFRKEEKLARGVRLSHSPQPSFIFFTTQKCASRYVSRVLSALASSAGMVHADYDAYVAMTKVTVNGNPFRADGALDHAFDPTGYYYGPIGSFRLIPNFHSYKCVLQLRDPRDVMTSLYFSTTHSHALINPKLIRRRQEAQQMSIDEFVLAMTAEYLSIYSEYIDKLLGQPNVLFLKYEDMVASFPAWLNRLSGHVELGQQIHVIETLQKEANFSVNVEDVNSQKRQVTPGDHKRKLKRETIAELNATFGPILSKLNYQ
jgi:hypothetical protein